VASEFIYVAGTIEEGVIGVEMKMGKLCCHAPILGVRHIAFSEDKWVGIRLDSPWLQIFLRSAVTLSAAAVSMGEASQEAARCVLVGQLCVCWS
jgi:hypothetical protein